MKKKIAFGAILVLLILMTFAGGTVYSLFIKVKSISHSATNISGASTMVPEENLNTTLAMPTADFTGQDLENVPRYSGAIRTNYYVSEDKAFTSVEYVAPVTAEVLNAYYNDYLQKKNWTLASNDQITANYTSEGYNLTIETIAENSSPVLTKYSLNLTKTTF